MRVLGSYVLTHRISAGGMGEVWRATTTSEGIERVVAIKRLLPDVLADEDFVRMFVEEARLTVQFAHGNIARVYELGVADGALFLAMEYVEGHDLRSVFLKRQPPNPTPIPFACAVMAQVCEALDYAHHKADALGQPLNVIHRDVSLNNVLLSYDGEVKLIDFGIAKAAGRIGTVGGIIKGKIAYMSPEHLAGSALDPRTDIYSAGICLYELLTGERLFVAPTDFELFQRVAQADVRPPSELHPAIPDALEAIVMKALNRERDQRFTTAAEFASALWKFLLEADLPFGRNEISRFMRSTFAEEQATRLVRLPVPEAVPKVTGETTRRERFAAPELSPMASVPGGRVGDERVNPFELDVWPVTGTQFARFIAATGQPPPKSWGGRRQPPADLADQPVTDVTWLTAQAFASWAGKRLPTVWEWRCAALCTEPRWQGLGSLWEWTQSEAPLAGYWVCGGRYRNLADAQPSIEHVSFEVAPAPDVGFRCAADQKVSPSLGK